MRLFKIKYNDNNVNKYFVTSAKNLRDAKKLFKKTMPSYKIATEPRAATEKFIENSEPIKKQNTKYYIVPVKKRFVDNKGKFISTKDTENIRAFYKENFTVDERKKINLYNEIRKMDKNTFEQTSQAGSGMIIDKKLMYVGRDDTGQSSVQLNYKQRLSAAKKMNTKYRVVDEKGKEKIVPLKEFEDIIEEAIQQSKKEWEEDTGTYYKTILFMGYDSTNNVLTFDYDMTSY